MTDLIVDANSLHARSWYAALKAVNFQRAKPVTTISDPSLVLRLSAVTILNLINPLRSEIGTPIHRTLFCWDSGTHEAKHREPRPQEYYDIRDITKDLFALLLGSANVEIDPFEGDDLVASAVYNCDKDAEICVVSGDKDLMQLIDKHVSYYSLHEKCVLSDSFVCNKFHVKRPSQIALALAIQGDTVDNIPGVRGWGKEKVKKLFKSVTKEMTFEETIGALENFMHADQRQQFYEALERTIPQTNLPVPPPAPLVFCDEEIVVSLGMPEVTNRFRDTAYAYDVLGQESVGADDFK